MHNSSQWKYIYTHIHTFDNHLLLIFTCVETKKNFFFLVAHHSEIQANSFKAPHHNTQYYSNYGESYFMDILEEFCPNPFPLLPLWVSGILTTQKGKLLLPFRKIKILKSLFPLDHFSLGLWMYITSYINLAYIYC